MKSLKKAYPKFYIFVKNKIACGIHMVDPKQGDIKSNIKKGFTFLAYSMDTSFLKNIKLK